MSIQFLDGFDHYSVNTQWMYKWDQYSGSAPIVESSSPRNSFGQACKFTQANWLQKYLPSSQAWRIGFGLYVNTTNSTMNNLIQLYDGTTVQCELGLDSTRHLRVTRNNTLVGSASTNAIANQTWVYIEWYIVITDTLSSGYCTVKVSGVTELDVTSGDTKNTANASANGLRIGGQTSWDYRYDDLVISDMAVTGSPTFLGDQRVYTIYPGGDGNYSQHVGSDSNSVNNYQLVDETGTIDLTDYVGSSTVNDRDSYAITDPGITVGTVSAVQINTCQAKTDAGIRTTKSFVRISGTNYDSAELFPADSPTILRNLMEASPATSSAWTSTEINNLEAGVKVES